MILPLGQAPAPAGSPAQQADSRRHFLKTSAAGIGATIALSQASFLASNEATDLRPEKKLGFALVGLGWLATHQIAPALAKTKHCRLAGIVSGTPAKIQ